MYIVAYHHLRKMFLSISCFSDSSLKLLVVPKDEDILQMVRTENDEYLLKCGLDDNCDTCIFLS